MATQAKRQAETETLLAGVIAELGLEERTAVEPGWFISAMRKKPRGRLKRVLECSSDTPIYGPETVAGVALEISKPALRFFEDRFPGGWECMPVDVDEYRVEEGLARSTLWWWVFSNQDSEFLPVLVQTQASHWFELPDQNPRWRVDLLCQEIARESAVAGGGARG